MTSTTYITLNLQAPNTAVTVNAKQNDRLSRYISAALYDGSVAFVPPVGASAAIRYKKPDGTGGFYDADEDANPAIVITGSTARLTLAEQCTTVPGEVYMELNFYTTAGDKLTSFTWLLKVEQSVLTDATIVSSDYYNVLTAAIATTLEYRDAAAASATAAAASATTAEYWAGIAQGLTAGIKGYFATPAALVAAYPIGQDGWWAIVGSTDTIWVWDSDTTAWTDTGDVAASVSIADAGNYFTATNVEGALQEAAAYLTPTGAILTYAGTTAPAGWLLCNGANISRTTYAALFAILGTTYGAGDGSTTFAVPDMRGRVGVGIGASDVNTLGQKGGEQTHVLSENEMPVHKHGKGGYATAVGTGDNYYVGVQAPTVFGAGYTENAGGGLSHNNMQPYVGINYIIKT